MGALKVVAPVLAAVVFVTLAYFLLRGELDSEPPPETATVVEPRPPAPPPPARPEPPAEPMRPAVVEPAPSPAEPEPALPPLDESDAFVRAEIEAFRLPSSWTAGKGLLRRAAVAIDNAQRGDIFRRPIAFLRPESPFRVVEQDGRVYAHPANSARFDGFAALVERIDPLDAARVFTRLEPLLDAGFRELGSADSAREALREALSRVIESDLPLGPHELVRPKVLWRYADEDLESASDLDKQLLRLGPENRARLQRAAAALRRALEL